jgi:glycosyltransferase involved in cell wall biosynthesis
MKIVHTYINNMYIDPNDESKECFANKWGLVSLAKLGHEVTLICGNDSGSKTKKEYFWNGIKVIELPVLFGINNTSRLLKKNVKELREIDADIFHSHHYCSFIPELTVLVGKLRKIPTFVTFHNTLVEGNILTKFLGLIYLLVMQPFLQLYFKIFFISEYTKDKLFFNLIPRNKKVVIYNNMIEPKKIKIVKKEQSILFIGRLTHQKGVDIIIKALKIVKKDFLSIRLNIIGPGSKRYNKNLKKLVKKNNLKEHVNFLGEKFGKEKWKEFYSNQILIVPSRDEGFGNVVIEGMLCDVPVITSNKGALPEAGGGKSIIFNINKPEDLARKIINLLKNEELREKLSKEGKNYAQNFTKNTIGKRLIKEYENAIRKTS